MSYKTRMKGIDKYVTPLMMEAVKMALHIGMSYDQIKRCMDRCYKEVKYGE